MEKYIALQEIEIISVIYCLNGSYSVKLLLVTRLVFENLPAAV